MKIPVWLKDKNGKYHRIPPNLIEEFADGHIGISGCRAAQTLEVQSFMINALASGIFRWEVNTDRLIYMDPNSPYQSSNP